MNEKFMVIFAAEFEKVLSTKTGWGRNEIILAFNKAAVSAAMRVIDEMGE